MTVFVRVNAYLGLYVLPFLAYLICKNLPHLLADTDIGSGKMFHLDGVPAIAVVTLLHETFMPFTACVCALVWEVLGSNWLPIESLLASTHKQLVLLWRPCLGCMTISSGVVR